MCQKSLQGPAAVLLDQRVDVRHQFSRADQAGDDLAIAGEIVRAQSASLAIEEPFPGYLVPADGERPGIRGHMAKILLRIDRNAATMLMRRVGYPRYQIVVWRRGPGQSGRQGLFQQMRPGERVTCQTELAEEVRVPGQRNAGEINFQKIGVTCSIIGSVEQRVNIRKNVFGPKSRVQVSPAIRQPAQRQAPTDFRAKGWREIGRTRGAWRRVEIQWKEIIAPASVEIKLRRQAAAKGDIPVVSSVDNLSSPANRQREIRTSPHMSRHTLAQVHRYVPLENGPARIKGAVMDALQRGAPGALA